MGVFGEPVGEDAGGFPALVVVDGDAGFHFFDDFLFHARVVEVHEGEGFVSDLGGGEERHVLLEAELIVAAARAQGLVF